MRIGITNIIPAITLLFIISTITFGQKLNYSIELGPSIPFLSNETIELGYSHKAGHPTGYSYVMRDNEYTRNSELGAGAFLGFKLEYNFSRKFQLISGLSLDYLNNKVTTQLSSSAYTLGTANTNPDLTLGENIDGFIPVDSEGNTIWRLLLDENGIPVAENESLYESYKTKEQFSNVYISIPFKFGYAVGKNFQFNLGVINSFLIYSKINTTYPYNDSRIIIDNISTFNKYMCLIEGGVSYKVAKRIFIFLNYQRSITDIIDLNSRYDVENGNKLNNFIIGLRFQLNRIESIVN